MWTPLYNGPTGLAALATKKDYGTYQSIPNTISFTSYRFLMTSKRDVSNFVSYSEVQLFGYAGSATGSPPAPTTGKHLVRFSFRAHLPLTSSLLASALPVQIESVQGLWKTVAGGMSSIATSGTGPGTYVGGQAPDNLFDGRRSTIYTSRGNSSSGSNAIAGLNTGFHVTVAQCQPTLTQFRYATSNLADDYDPSNITVEGSHCSNLASCSSWTLLYQGPSGLETTANRTTYGTTQMIASPQRFENYRFLVTSKRNATQTPYVSYSEVELYGY